MSGYGNPPQDPYGQDPQDPYGQPPAYGQQPAYGQHSHGEPAYGQNPYGQAPYGQPGYGAPQVGYAHWIKRVGATLIDGIIATVLAIPMYVGLGIAFSDLRTDPVTNETTGDVNGGGLAIMAVGLLLVLGFFIWNICIRQGQTGYTIGKTMIGIKLVKEATGQPIGAGMAFVRYLCHFFDGLLCYLGYLWPLWDSKRQTFADKLVSTVVLDRPSDRR